MVQNIGRYRILERIGRGGAGTVFKAHDPMLDRLVAIKVISSEGGITDELKTRFYREAQACARLIHPNIVVVHDLGDDQGRLYIVMEFLDGDELKAQIQQRKPLSLQDKVSLMAQVCDGLHYAHQHGVIHRDIKPGNIFILRNGQVKILDFGIARIATDSGLTRTGLVMGTLRYMSPEQARGKVDHRSDMFSAGTVFYELLGYKPAFDWDDPMEALEKLRNAKPTPLAQIDPTLPADLVEVVEQALQKDPNQRFPDMGEMRTRLEHVRRRLGDETEQLLSQARGILDEIRELQGRLGEARAAAAQMEAARHAAAAWSEAEAKAGEGTRALEQHAYGVARGHFQAAVTAYERAAAAARQAIQGGPRQQAQADAARKAAETARAAAEQAEAQARANAAAATRAAAEQAEAQARANAAAATRAAAEQAEAQARANAAAATRAAAEQAEAQARADAAGRAAAEARQKAIEVRAASLVAGKWAAAQAKEKSGQSAAGRKDLAAAEAAFGEARHLYEEATREAAVAADAATRAGDQKAEVDRLRQLVAAARRAADEAGAGRRATEPFGRAKAAEQAAAEAVGRQAFDEAVSRLRAAEQAYQEAARRATEEVRTAKANAEQASRDASQAKQAVAALNPASRASSAARWSAAQAREAAGQAAFGRGDWAAAQTLLGEARRLYDEVLRDARAVAGVEDRRKAAETESAGLREAAAAARRAAEEAGAAQAAPARAELQAARTAEQAGEAALARRAHDEAQTQFRAAERAYQDAARHASAQQAASAAVAEAQRLIAEGQPDRAREALARAREGDPEHPEIPRLGAQIERLAEERKRREQVQSLLAQARRLQAQGELARALDYAEEAVQLAPADAAATRLRDDLQEAAHQAATRPVEAMPAASAPVAPAFEPPASPQSGRDRRASAPPARSPEPRRPAAVAPQRPGGGGFDPRKMAAVAVAALVLAVGGGYAIWSVTRPAGIPSVTTLERLREKVAEARRGAQAADAPGLAARLWTRATGIEQEGEDALKRGDLASAAGLFEEAEKAYRDAEGDARKKPRAPR